MANGPITPGEHFESYDFIGVDVKGRNAPEPVMSFRDSGLQSLLFKNLDDMGLDKLTPIQKHSIPIIKQGRDLIACAETGSGKTYAYLVPIMDYLLGNQKTVKSDNVQAKPQVLILAPTREVTIQIQDDCDLLAKNSHIATMAVYGGVKNKKQAAQLFKKKANILVATPGRLLAFLKKEIVSFESIRFVVIDEADSMLMIDFLPAIKKVMGHETMVRLEYRQTMMFSAYPAGRIEKEAQRYMTDYLRAATVSIFCPNINQTILEVPLGQKEDKLLETLIKHEGKSTIIFVKTKNYAKLMASILEIEGFDVTLMSSDKSQYQRETALQEFKEKKFPILVSTDLTARGLNIACLDHVINYDLPEHISVYMYRIGRVGRMGNPGLSTSFFSPNNPNDKYLGPDLVYALAHSEQIVPEFLLPYLNISNIENFGNKAPRRRHFQKKSGRKRINQTKFFTLPGIRGAVYQDDTSSRTNFICSSTAGTTGITPTLSVVTASMAEQPSKQKYFRKVMLTFSADGKDVAAEVARVMRQERGSARIGVLILGEQIQHMHPDPHSFINASFQMVDYVMPIITADYLKNVLSKPRFEESNVNCVDAQFVPFVYQIMIQDYIRRGCLNDKVRCLIPDDSVESIMNQLMKAGPWFSAWERVSRAGILAETILKD